MAKSPQLVVDIGQQQIKVLQLKKGGKGEISVLKAGKIPIPIAPGAEQEEFYQKVSETLPILLQQLGIKEKRAIISLPGRAAFTRRLQVPIVRGRQLDRIIRYEARQHIPFPLEQINMDYQVSKAEGDVPELDVNLVAVRKEFSDGYSQALKKCKIRSDVIEAAPLSIYNAYASSPQRDVNEVTAIICIGASSLDIVIEQDGAMQFMRSAPVAGNQLTSMLAKELQIPAEQAEELKKKAASQYENEGDFSAEKVSSILEKGFERIVTEIRKSFDFYVSQTQAQPVTRILICGGTAYMEGVNEFLEDRLGVPVNVLETENIENISIPEEYKSIVKNEPVLIGMALRAADRAVCSLSFSPAQIKEKLELERRAPMLSMMAVLLIVMLAGAIYFLNIMLNTRRQAVAQVRQVVEPVVSQNEELTQVRNVQEKYMERFKKINQVAEKRGYLSRLFLEVQRLIPQYIWLDTIELTSAKMVIKGRSLRDEQISSYIQSLYMSPFFDNNAVVYRDADIVPDPLNPAQTRIQFTIELISFNHPTESEIKFVNDLRDRTKDTSILLVKFIRDVPDDPTSKSTALLGVYEEESQQEEINIINKVYTSLVAAQDESVTHIEVRFHDRGYEEVKRIRVTRDAIDRYKDGRLSQDGLVEEFTFITPSPSPTPSPTPTPDLEEGDDTSTGMYGMYGMGYGMGGMGYGMGGMGAPMGGGG